MAAIFIAEIETVPGAYYRVDITNDGAETPMYLYVNGIAVAQSYGVSAGAVFRSAFRAYSDLCYIDVESESDVSARIFRIRQNPHENWDGTGMTVSYNGIVNRWTKRMSYSPDMFGMLPNLLCSFKDGDLHLHDNLEQRANFYGVQYPWSVSVLTKENMPAMKQPKFISVEGNMAPDWVHIRTERPNEQSTDLLAPDWRNYEGRFYAAVLRDRTTPGMDETTETPVLTGDVMIGDHVIVGAEFSDPSAFLNAINIQYNESKGHK